MQDILIIDFNPNQYNLINYSVTNSPQKSESIYQFNKVLSFIYKVLPKKHEYLLEIQKYQKIILTLLINYNLEQGNQWSRSTSYKLKIVFIKFKSCGQFGIEKGGIYYNQTSESHNYAKEGGGIYFEGNSSLNMENFNISLLLQNKAKFPSYNIHELLSHLAVQINYQEMHFIEKIINNQSIYTLYINPQKIISQDKLIETNQLTIPSGQTVANYQFYNSKIQKYLSYFNDFSIIFKNSMNEVQFNYLDSQYNLTQELFDIQTQNLQNYKVFFLILIQQIKYWLINFHI